MRASILLLAASLIQPCAAAYADTFNTTITGGGNTIFFPNVGGPSNYTVYTRVNEVYAAPLYVYVNGGARTQGALTFFYAGSGPTYNDLDVYIPSSTGQTISLILYGPDLLGFVNLIGFYSFPGTYNLTDSAGTPYTYVVTDNTLAAVPEPSTLSLLAIGTIGMLFLMRRQHVHARTPI